MWAQRHGDVVAIGVIAGLAVLLVCSPVIGAGFSDLGPVLGPLAFAGGLFVGGFLGASIVWWIMRRIRPSPTAGNGAVAGVLGALLTHILLSMWAGISAGGLRNVEVTPIIFVFSLGVVGWLSLPIEIGRASCRERV